MFDIRNIYSTVDLSCWVPLHHAYDNVNETWDKHANYSYEAVRWRNAVIEAWQYLST